MSIITKVKLHNYKKFRDYVLKPNPHINILIGDNEAGKSSIIEAIDLVASGNLRRVEAIGIDRLMSIEAVQEFNSGERIYANLPKMIIELYLSGEYDERVNGKNNTDGVVCDGIRLICEPNFDFQNEINEALKEQNEYFPYDYYLFRFSTFADEGYTGYKKLLKTILIDSTNMNSDYATNDFIKRTYLQYTEGNEKERTVHRGKYRQLKNNFRSTCLKDINDRIPSGKGYAFGLKTSSSTDFDSSLMIYENEVSIDNKGTGKQVFIKTDFALEKSGNNMDVILIEEPENHLSHVNLRRLIQKVSSTQEGQIFVTTHNSLVSTRLELRNLLIIGQEGTLMSPTSLADLSEATAQYFMKAPVASIVEFVTSRKLVLVEGPSEYMLLERFYKAIIGREPEQDGVHVINVQGLSFKRYLEVAQSTCSKVAVVTDNDGDSEKNCAEKYVEYSNNKNLEIFYSKNNTERTFEIALYECNKPLCDKLFGSDAQKYMLNNKTEAAFTLLNQSENICVPQYIREAILWIKD